jgi:acyl-CoA dehydrogenase
MTPSTAHLGLPFFDDAAPELAQPTGGLGARPAVDERDDRAACREWVRRLGEAGWLRYCVPQAHGGALERLDSRALVILRETLAFHSPLADFALPCRAWAAVPSRWPERPRNRRTT